MEVWEPVCWRICLLRLSRACLAIVVVAVLLVLAGRAHAVQDGAVAAPGVSTGLPSSIPVRREGVQETAGPGGDRWWLAVTAAAGLLAVAVLVARRRAAPAKTQSGPLWARFGGLLDSNGASQEIQRVSSTRLSPRHSLHVVAWNGRRLLLGCTEQSIQVLAESPSEPGDSHMPSDPGPSAGLDARA